MRKKIVVLVFVAMFASLAACTHRLTVDPIHITVDVNIKVDKALDDFFGDLDNTGTATEKAPATQ